MSDEPTPKLTYRGLLELLQKMPKETLDKEVKVFMHGRGDQEIWGTAREIFEWDHEAHEDDDGANVLGVLWDLPDDIELMDDAILQAW